VRSRPLKPLRRHRRPAALNDGRLCITTLGLIAPLLTPQNVDGKDFIERLIHQKRQDARSRSTRMSESLPPVGAHSQSG